MPPDPIGHARVEKHGWSCLYNRGNSTIWPFPSPQARLLSPDLHPLTTPKTDLDDDHKEIHFSLDYIHSQPSSRLTPEITGVLTHELVHCFQYDAEHSCPGGLIEGIADWVRLKCDLSPPHWKRRTEGG